MHLSGQSISIAVLTENQDDVAQINGTLRDAGHAAKCHWINRPDKLGDTFAAENVELLIVNCDKYPESIRQVVKTKDAAGNIVNVTESPGFHDGPVVSTLLPSPPFFPFCFSCFFFLYYFMNQLFSLNTPFSSTHTPSIEQLHAETDVAIFFTQI